ncbi:hypothetical protein Q5752_000186 [Cryptotrichosporon argae]
MCAPDTLEATPHHSPVLDASIPYNTRPKCAQCGKKTVAVKGDKCTECMAKAAGK